MSALARGSSFGSNSVVAGIGVDQSFVEKVKAARKQLPSSQVGDTGELQEWIGD
jgi:hypothetical protein